MYYYYFVKKEVDFKTNVKYSRLMSYHYFYNLYTLTCTVIKIVFSVTQLMTFCFCQAVTNDCNDCSLQFVFKISITNSNQVKYNDIGSRPE